VKKRVKYMLKFHPKTGTIVLCDYNTGFAPPEMTKRRPALVISPQFKRRNNLCTIVPFSTTAPEPIMPYHYLLHLNPTLPPPYNSQKQWVKADMLATVSFKRLSLPFSGKGIDGKREYIKRVVDRHDFKSIQKAILNAIGLNRLTSYI
jgi:mRNA interferase MazF